MRQVVWEDYFHWMIDPNYPKVVADDQAKARRSSMPIAVFRKANARRWSHFKASCVPPAHAICSLRNPKGRDLSCLVRNVLATTGKGIAREGLLTRVETSIG